MSSRRTIELRVQGRTFITRVHNLETFIIVRASRKKLGFLVYHDRSMGLRPRARIAEPAVLRAQRPTLRRLRLRRDNAYDARTSWTGSVQLTFQLHRKTFLF